MEQTFNIAQIWNIIVKSNTFNFLIFVGIIAFVAKKIDAKSAIDSLHTAIIEFIEKAKKAKADAHLELKNAEKAVENLPQEIEIIKTEAQKSADVIEKKVLDEAEKQRAQIINNAQKVIEAEEKMIKSMLIKKASKESVQNAKNNIAQALKDDPKLHEKFIEESIDELDKLSL